MFRKTKLSEKLHTLIAALIVFFLFAGSFDLSCMYAYADEPEHIVFNQMNVVAEAYINDDRYVGQSPNFTVMNGYVQQAENLGLAANNPARYELPTPGGGRLEITNQTDGSERSWDVEIEGNTYYLCNLTPGCIYSCVLRDKEDNDIVKKSYTVEVTGSLRMIYLEGTTNFRDLGGWNVGRGKIKYNRIIRGAATAGRADSVGNRFALTDKDKDLLWQLGIDHEYDLRKDTDEDDIPGTPAEKYQSEIPGIENQYTRISTP